MKQILLFLLAILLNATNISAQKRLVLYEEFTGDWCPPSRPSDSTLWVLMNTGTNPDNIQYITYAWAPGKLYNTNTIDYTARANYYSVPFISYGRLDGELHDTWTINPGLPGHLTQTTLDNEIATLAPFNITAYYEYNPTGDSITIQVHIVCVATYIPFPAGVKLRAAIVRTLDYVTAPGSNGMKHFENMVRKMYPTPNGLPITNMWAIGDSAAFTITGKVYSETADSTLNPHTSSVGRVVVWIQNDSDKIVAQAARATMGLPPISTSSVVTNDKEYNVTVYPNPAKDGATLSFETACDCKASIIVTDISGRTVYNVDETLNKGLHYVSIPTKNMANGLYNTRLTVDAKTYTSTLLVEK